MPKTSRFLPLPPQRKKDYYFCYECLRLICERLFGVIDCYSQYSKEIPPKEFGDDNDLEMVVTKVTIHLGSMSFYTPRKLCLWEGILFSRCPTDHPTDRPTDRVSVTFCFFNNFKNH